MQACFRAGLRAVGEQKAEALGQGARGNCVHAEESLDGSECHCRNLFLPHTESMWSSLTSILPFCICYTSTHLDSESCYRPHPLPEYRIATSNYERAPWIQHAPASREHDYPTWHRSILHQPIPPAPTQEPPPSMRRIQTPMPPLGNDQEPRQRLGNLMSSRK